MTWLLFRGPPCTPAENMAWDEALLESVARIGKPVLRFYGWAEPAATFGYFQKCTEVERMTALRPLIRRPTGGGLVPHDADWTYSVALPPTDSWYSLSAAGSYQRMHEWIRSAFAEVRVAAELASACRKEMPGQCFAGAERFDVTFSGQKIAGAAQRRTKSGLLIQGSIQPPAGTERNAFETAMQNVATRLWTVEWGKLTPDGTLKQRARELTSEKYSRDEFNRRR